MIETAILKALADPTRRAVYERLAGHELSVVELTKGADVSQPAVSKHLAQLREAGLVRPEPQGRETFYHAEPRALAPLADWLSDATQFWSGRLDKLGDLLKRMDQ